MDSTSKALVIPLLLTLLTALPSGANERIKSREALLAEGYQYRAISSPFDLVADQNVLPAPHALAWPVKFQDESHSLGNVMAQYQPFGAPPYFHGGCDLRVDAGADIHAPVAGRIEAGHYSYTALETGELQKYWKPWPQEGDATYFEVSVIADDGTRFEFHHVNETTLPEEVVAMLNAGGGRVSAGQVIGHVITWPDGDYHHTHYNIILPSGRRVNPEFASVLLPDHVAPRIIAAFAVEGVQVGASPFADGHFTVAPREFIFSIIDQLDGGVYEHPPALAVLRFASGQEVKWDFRQVLATSDGSFPVLRDVFAIDLALIDGSTTSTEGGYGTGQSLIRFKVPAQASGAFTLEFSDIAGNTSRLSGVIDARALILR